VETSQEVFSSRFYCKEFSLNPQSSFDSVQYLSFSCPVNPRRTRSLVRLLKTRTKILSTLGYKGLGKRKNLHQHRSQPFTGEFATSISCLCTCCILDICFVLNVTVTIVFVFYFNISSRTCYQLWAASIELLGQSLFLLDTQLLW
jgi:hypothetical protein